MSEWSLAKTFSLDGTDIGTTRIELDNLAYDLSHEEQTKLIEWVLDGICPFCQERIPMNDRVCCNCLGEIANYHERQDGCIGIQRG